MPRLERVRAVDEGGICLALWRGGGGCRNGSGGCGFVFEAGGDERGLCFLFLRAMEIEIEIERGRGFFLSSLE